jgi:hypothetical protein
LANTVVERLNAKASKAANFTDFILFSLGMEDAGHTYPTVNY